MWKLIQEEGSTEMEIARHSRMGGECKQNAKVQPKTIRKARWRLKLNSLERDGGKCR